MSSSGRGRAAARKSKGRGEGSDIDLGHVVLFLRVIFVMTGALLIVTIACFALGQNSPAGSVVYTITILANAIACGGSALGAWWLDRKDEELTRREIQKKSQQLKKGAKHHESHDPGPGAGG